jgi:hypothetical protein
MFLLYQIKMKKKLTIARVVLLSLLVLFSCKKSTTPTPRDYTSSIKNKTWWGMVTNNGWAPEYYSVYFNADNSFKWNQLSGEYDGKWTVTGNQLSLTFPALSIEIKADIGDNDRLMNFTDNNPNSIMNSGKLVENPNIPLDNTIWNGSFLQGGASYPLKILFTGGSQIRLVVDNVQPPVIGVYARSATGGSFRVYGIGSAFFGVLSAPGEMKGSSAVDRSTSWTVTRE